MSRRIKNEGKYMEKIKEELDILRQKIDEIDNQIIELLRKRANIAMEIGNIKRKYNLPTFVPEREYQIYQKIEKLDTSPLPSLAVKSIFREIISACRSLEEPLKVGFLGPRGTFSELAVNKYFGSSVKKIPLSTIKEVFEEVEKDRINYGIVPIENSIEGIVSFTADMFLESNLKICGELYIPIALHLLSKEDNIKSIKKVYSHRQALAQCKTFLLEKIPQAKLVEVESTAKAAELASKEKGAAAVASEIAALEYDLNILEKNIQETSLNYTRFLVLSKKDAENPTGNDKTSIIFSVKHTPGALFKALRPFALYDVNLTKLESRPIKNKPFKYIFFCDFEGHRKDKKIQKLLQELKEEVSYLHILGSYPKADMNVGEENE